MMHICLSKFYFTPKTTFYAVKIILKYTKFVRTFAIIFFLMTQDAKSRFCSRLKMVRKSNKITQEKLGLLIGLDEFVASTRINRYEKAVHIADPNTAERIAQVLDEPLSFFYAETEELAELNRIFYHLDLVNKQQLLAFARELISIAKD